MPESFYFLRHGETDANRRGLMCGGDWDLPLTDTGLAQARAAAAELRERRIALGSICVSPLHRARQTAEIIGADYALTPIVIEGLREWSLGRWDRVPFESVREQFLGDGEPPGGEPRSVIQARVAAALRSAGEKPGPRLIVAHGGVWIALERMLGMPTFRMRNATPYELAMAADGSWSARPL